MSNFIHLHNHSHYSLLDGLTKVPALVRRAKELGMSAVGLTDHGVMYGVIEFYKECLKQGIKPIVGMETYVAARKLTDKQPGIDAKNNHLILWAKNEAGYKNLIKLTSKAHIEGFYYKPRIDDDYLAEHADGLIGASACLKGKIPQLLLEHRYDEAKKTVKFYQNIFGPDNFYLELEHHPELSRQNEANKLLIKLAKDTGAPLILTKDSHYLDPSDNEAQDALVCIQTGKIMDDAKRLDMTGFDASLIRPEAMINYARELGCPEAAANSLKIADQCDLKLDLSTWHFPKFQVPTNQPSSEYLRDLTYQGLKKREGKVTEKDKERLDYELDIIISKQYADYFLIVADFMNWAHEHGIIATTRGSASGSLVSYALGITSVNPLRFQLPFERFLTKTRPSPPDIDCDIQDSRRDEVINYVREKYGRRQVANIGTFGTLKARAAVRDITRVLGLPYGVGDKIAKLIPQGPQGTNIDIERAKQMSAELQELYQNDGNIKKILDLSQKIEGCVRHVSVHAAGVVIAPEKLTSFLPLQIEPKGKEIITQYDMHAVDPNVEKDTVGLLKMDLLGIRNLSILGIAREIVKHTKKQDVDPQKISWNDKKTYALLSDGRTMGVFQLSSSGMTRYLKELKPDNIYDIMAMVALYRPGPMEALPEFIRRKHNPRLITYFDPRVKSILEKSYGMITYQDDVLLVAITIAGYSWEEADKLRKAMGKKIASLMAEQKDKFIGGCVKNGLAKTKAAEIFKLIEPFAGYGFNKCLAGDTKIVNPNTGEIKTIKEMHGNQNKSNILSLNLETNKIELKMAPKIYSNGEKIVWQIRTRTGKKIKATANHPFLKFNGWVNLENLKVGDRIAGARKIKYKGRFKIESYKLIVLGYLLAEGNLCHPNGIYFYSSDKDEINDYIKSLKKFNNIRPTINDSKSAKSVYSTLINQKQGNPAARWIRKLGLWNKKAVTKFFPEFVFKLNRKQLSLLLGKLWQGDGCVHARRGGQLFYATSSKTLAEQLQHLLLRLDIISTIHAKQFKYRGSFKYGYTINISRFNNIINFNQTIGEHLIGKKKKTLQILINNNKIINGTIHEYSARGSKDLVPVDIITALKHELSQRGFSAKSFARKFKLSERNFHVCKNKKGYLRETINTIADKLNSSKLKFYAHSDIYWDEVIEIKKLGIETTYDLTVPGNHNFVANDLIVHNSHAASYAVVAYQTAYMKANYPAEFMAALMTAESGNTDKIAEAVAECEKMGIKVLPPDINLSLSDFTYISDNEIRFGLKAIKNLGEDIIATIIKERKSSGAFKSIEDCLKRVHTKNLNKKSLEALIKAGAMDDLGERNQLIQNMDRLLAFIKTNERERHTGQYSLFGNKLDNKIRLILEPAAPAEEREKLAWEKELLGLYVSSHPFRNYEKYFNEMTVPCRHIAEKKIASGQPVAIAGFVSSIKKIFTKRNELMMFVMIEDTSSQIETIVFPKLLQRNSMIWREDNLILIKGKISDKDDAPKILADQAFEIDQNNPESVLDKINGENNNYEKNITRRIYKPREIYISISARNFNKDAHGRLKNFLEDNHGQNRVYLMVKQNGNIRKIATNFYINFSDKIKAEIELFTGEKSVEAKMAG